MRGPALLCAAGVLAVAPAVPALAEGSARVAPPAEVALAEVATMHGDHFDGGPPSWFGYVTVRLDRTGDTTQESRVGWTLVAGTATPGEDLGGTTTSGVLTIGRGATSGWLSLPLVLDDAVEGTEEMTVAWEALEGAALERATTRLVISDDELGRTWGLAGGELVTFSVSRPDAAVTRAPITGLGGDPLVGLAVRPQTGDLLGVGRSGRLFRIEPASAAAAPVGEPQAAPLTGTRFGVGVDPVNDLVHVVSDTGAWRRLDPATGQVVATGEGPPADGLAFSPTGTALAVDTARDVLVRGAGDESEVVGAGLGVDAVEAALDVAGAGGALLAVLETAGGARGVYRVSTDTGRAHLLAPAPAGVTSLAIGHPGRLVVDASPLTVGEKGPHLGIRIIREGGTSGDVGVHLATVDGTAVGGRYTGDFFRLDPHRLWFVTLPDGVRSGSAGTTVYDDQEREATEGFQLVVLGPRAPGGAPVPRTAVAVTVVDDDSCAPAVEKPTDTVPYGGPVDVVVRASPGSEVELRAVPRPSTQERVIRTGTADASGRAVFRLRPTSTTGLRATVAGCTGTSNDVVVVVSAAPTIDARRLGPRTYSFFGVTRPAVAQQAVRVYRSSPAGAVLVGTATSRADGTWSMTKRFAGTGRFDFRAVTFGSEAASSGSSRGRSTLVY